MRQLLAFLRRHLGSNFLHDLSPRAERGEGRGSTRRHNLPFDRLFTLLARESDDSPRCMGCARLARDEPEEVARGVGRIGEQRLEALGLKALATVEAPAEVA